MREIIITVSVEGETTIETKGFKGTECLKETAALELALGGVKMSDIKTREFHQGAAQSARATAGQ